MEVEEFVLEDEGDYGVYLIDGQVHESNTSKLSYSWGVDKNTIRTQYVEPAAREIIREVKRRLAEHQRVPSQEDAIHIAYSGIKRHKEQYTVFGTEMHKAFQNFDEGKPVILPTPKHQAFFQGFLYFRRQHEINTIFTEKLLICPHCGLTTQIDNFSEVDGQNTIMDYKTGRTVGFNTPFQLAVNKHVLEHLKYRVDRTWAVHVQDFFGYPIEMCAPWEDVELRLKNADLKRKTLNPKIYVREFSGEKTAEDRKKEAPSETLKTSEEQELAHDLTPPGHSYLQVIRDSLTTEHDLWNAQHLQSCRTCRGRADKQFLETNGLKRPVGRPRRMPQTEKPRKNPSANTSSRKADSRPQTPPEEAELDPKHLHPKRLKRRLFQQAA